LQISGGTGTDTASKMMMNSSILTTEKHYAKYDLGNKIKALDVIKLKNLQ